MSKVQKKWYPLQDQASLTLSKGDWRTIHSCLLSFAGIAENHGSDSTYILDFAEKIEQQNGADLTLSKGNWRTIHLCLLSFAGITVNHGSDAAYILDLANKLEQQI